MEGWRNLLEPLSRGLVKGPFSQKEAPEEGGILGGEVEFKMGGGFWVKKGGLLNSSGGNFRDIGGYI